MTALPTAPVRIGTRGSALALWQADHVAGRLTAVFPGLEARRVVVKTAGDRILDAPLSKIGDKGLFTKELESALRDGAIDAAVHSLKDLPTAVPAGLALGAVLEREDPRDVWISPSGRTLADLPKGARVGTSSLRRRSQILSRRPDLLVVDLRGNVPTRIEKAENGLYDAVVLARAGVLRLGLESKITEVLGLETVLPAVGQGAIAIEIREDDRPMHAMASALDHRPTRLATAAERGLLERLEGGCQVPIGAHATLEGRRLTLRALVSDLGGTTVIRGSDEEEIPDGAQGIERAAELGRRLAERLLDRGAAPILERIFREARP